MFALCPIWVFRTEISTYILHILSTHHSEKMENNMPPLHIVNNTSESTPTRESIDLVAPTHTIYIIKN